MNQLSGKKRATNQLKQIWLQGGASGLTASTGGSAEQWLQQLDLWLQKRAVEKQKSGYIVVDEHLFVLIDRIMPAIELDNASPFLAGQSLPEIFPELAGWADDLRQLFADAHAEPFRIPDVQRVFPDGSDRYFDLWIEPLLQSKDHWLVILNDVTEQAHLRQRLVQERNELRLNMIERQRAQQRQEELIGQLDAFARMVAHDLKTPLTSILGYARLLHTHGNLSPERKEQCLERIVRSGARMEQIIDGLLFLAKVNKSEVETERLDMARIVDDALDRLADLEAARQAEIILPDAWPVAMGYAPWLEEVWANYISNALKYGGRPPRLEFGSALASEGMVRFWLIDNGPGIAAEDQRHLFDEFSKIDARASDGHGLGLSIVKNIVQKLSGQVYIDSEIGRGSTFGFTLPQA